VTQLEETGPPQLLTGRRLRLVFTGLILGSLLAALDQTIISTALPTIVEDLGGAEHLAWVVTAYLLAATVSTPLWGKLGDLYGRKTLYQICILIFIVGSVLCGFAQDMTQLILFRALQGIGGGGLMVLAQAIIGDVVAPRDRGRYQGVFGAVYGLSSVAGPLIGGFIVDNLDWRWTFYVNVPIAAVALVVTAVVLPASVRRRQVRIDYAGILLLSGGVSALVLLTSLAGTSFDWLSWQSAALVAVAVVLLAFFVPSQRRAADPVMPLRLFTQPIFRSAAAISFVVGFAMMGSFTFLPTYFQNARGQSATASGLAMFPLMVGLLITSIGSGQIISRTGRYKVFPVVGCAIFTIGLLLFSTLDVDSPEIVVVSYLFLFGVGLGMVLQVLTIAVQNDVDYTDLGVATSGVAFFRSIGGCFGVAMFGAIYANRFATEIASGSSTATATADALQTVFLYAVPVGALAFVLALMLQEHPVRVAADAPDPGGFPQTRSSADELVRGLTSSLRRENVVAVYARLAERAGLSLSPGATWMLSRAGRMVDQAGGPVELPRGMTAAHLSYLQELLDKGYGTLTVEGALGDLTPAGREAYGRLVEAREAGLRQVLADWSPAEHADLARLINQLAGRLLGDEPERELAARGGVRGS
jgi:EmrB/QacA subfamily drug resistance transporter